MRTLRWSFIVAILLCLLPLLSSTAGDVAAMLAGCQVAELGFGKCLVRGNDVNDALASLQLLGPLSLWGVLGSLLIGLVWAIAEIIAMTIGRNTRRLRF